MLLTKTDPVSFGFWCCECEIGSLILGCEIRDCRQLELERCTDILQGRERLEGHGDSIRGSYYPIPHSTLPRTAIANDGTAR